MRLDRQLGAQVLRVFIEIEGNQETKQSRYILLEDTPCTVLTGNLLNNDSVKELEVTVAIAG